MPALLLKHTNPGFPVAHVLGTPGATTELSAGDAAHGHSMPGMRRLRCNNRGCVSCAAAGAAGRQDSTCADCQASITAVKVQITRLICLGVSRFMDLLYRLISEPCRYRAIKEPCG